MYEMGKVVETFSLGVLDVNTIDVIDFFEPKEIFIEGGEMIRRAEALHATPGLNQVRLMLNNFNEIPESLDKYDLVFAGAKKVCFMGIDRERDRNEYIAYMRKIRGRWLLGYGGIAFDWDLRARLVRFSLLF